MTTKPIRTIAAAAAVLAAGLVLAACESDNASGPSKAEVKDAISANAGGSATTTTATTPATTPATTTTQVTTTTTTPATTTTTAPPAADGKAIFTANCAACHTLSAAGASGAVGPNLDNLKPAAAAVSAQVNNGGGGMPAFKGQLSPAEITAVAAYVAGNAGK